MPSSFVFPEPAPDPVPVPDPTREPACFRDLLQQIADFGWDWQRLEDDAHGATWTFTRDGTTCRVTDDTGAAALHAFLAYLERDRPNA